MKNFGNLLLAAVLGSALSVGTMTIINDGEQVVKVRHEENLQASKALYTLDNEGEVVPLDFTLVAENVTETVVHIRSTIVAPSTSNKDNIPDPFREFFEPFNQQQGPRVGAGSGVIINENGYIVTNNHVIQDADDIEVALNDNRTYKATVIGADPTTDIAVLKIEEKGLPFLSFVDSDKVKVGEWVLAVGNPYNLNSTVTAGIISAKARSIGILAVPSQDGKANESIESFIQTDAAVNPGNSGGALVNLNSGLIGINTAIASPTGSYSGYSFAVPSNIVSKVVNDLIEYGTVQRGWLGVVITNVTDALARENDLNIVQGAYIQEMAENSSAKDAGVKPGDVIVKIDGRDIKNNTDVIGYVGQKRPGDKIKMTVNRGGEEKTFTITLKNREGNTEFIEKKDDIFAKLGAEFEELDTKTLKRLSLDHGIRVAKLNNGILRKETSMREGFIITAIAGKKVSKVSDIEEIFSHTSGGVLIEGRYEEYSKTEYYALGIN